MRKHNLILIVGLLFSTVAMSSTLEKARDLVAKGDKTEAWQILYPLAKQDGQGEAKFMLGHLLLMSPEVEGHSDKALLYFKAALSDGYTPASPVIKTIERQHLLNEKKSRTKAESRQLYEQNAAAWRSRFRKQRNSFISRDGQRYAHRLIVFVDGGGAITSQVESIISRHPNLSRHLLVRYVLVMDRENMGSLEIFPNDYAPPKAGFEPDFDGAEALKYGVDSFPALVLSRSKSNGSTIVSLSQFRDWATSWSPNR